jgi:thiol-disulfide isomerase/thioredoxin
VPFLNRRATVLGLAAIAVAAGIGGFLASRHLTAPPPAPPAESLPTAAAATTIPAVRPVFVLKDDKGVARSIEEWNGRPLAINFWATWCPPCRREIPLLNELRRRHSGDGLEIVGVAVDFREDVLAYMQKTPIEYPILIGEQDGLDAAKAFGMETMGYPFTVFTDSQGRIITVHVGELHSDQAEAILAAVKAVDAGTLTPAAARESIRSELAALKSKAG